MKNSIVIILSILLFGISHTTNAQTKVMDEFTVQVDGLGCPFCAYGLEKQFKALKGIKNLKIELETGLLRFEYPSDTKLSIEQVENQVDQAGYTPVSVFVERAEGGTEGSKDANTAKLAEEEGAKDIQFFVAGNCGRCKARIEEAASNVKGVESAVWDSETKQLVLKIASNVTQSAVEKAVAKAGHDT
ncbi:MAG: heavy metal-associated domain-containing protein, partial [Bacteroidota bacterium]